MVEMVNELAARYSYKLKRVNDLARGRSIPPAETGCNVSCVFDVRPGHLRHLMYAKSKGDVLIASIALMNI